jgi:3-phosphoinositide dependent protein kinase-1
MSRWQIFLLPDEIIVHTGTIYKRKGLFSKKRQLILTDSPRLIYIDPETMELKGAIPWTREKPVSCVFKNGKDFDVFCSESGRFYHLSDPSMRAQNWVDKINEILGTKKSLIRNRTISDPYFVNV